MTPPSATGRAPRVPLLMLGGLALGTGLWAGLARMGAAPAAPVSPMEHGPLMVSGFLGTVIALERAVAARVTWALLGPACCGLGALALVAGRHQAGGVLLTLGSAVVLAVLAKLVARGLELHEGILVLSCAMWLWGNALFAAGRAVHQVVPFWLVFLVGTIAAERLELNRLLPRTRGARASFLAGFALLVAGAPLSLFSADWGLRALGLGALVLAGWMLAFDVARRTILMAGQVRYIAAALLAGYVWLGVFGALALGLGNPLAGPHYDALMHAVLVGFVFSMIFGHALIILPAVAGVRVPYKSRFYVHLALLHGALAARLVGDFSGNLALRQGAAWASTFAIALFLGSTLWAALGPHQAPMFRKEVPQ